MSRVRVVQYVVQPVLMVDDGDTLTPLNLQPLTVPASEWAAFVVHGLAEALTQLQAQVDAGTPPGDDDDGQVGVPAKPLPTPPSGPAHAAELTEP